MKSKIALAFEKCKKEKESLGGSLQSREKGL